MYECIECYCCYFYFLFIPSLDFYLFIYLFARCCYFFAWYLVHINSEIFPSNCYEYETHGKIKEEWKKNIEMRKITTTKNGDLDIFTIVIVCNYVCAGIRFSNTNFLFSFFFSVLFCLFYSMLFSLRKMINMKWSCSH